MSWRRNFIEAEKTGDSALSEKVKWAYLLSDLPVF